MKKLFKRLLLAVVCLALAFVGVRFGPNIYGRLFGNGNTQWISERFSESLREKNELVVYEIETTGQETVSQDAWLFGTVQKVEMPYTFQMRFTVDLSLAVVSANAGVIEVRVPAPKPGYQRLTVDEEKMKKTDWLYPLTPERYAAIKTEVENRLFEEYSHNAEYIQNAWKTTEKNLVTLFKSIAEHSEQGMTCDIVIVRDDALGTTPEITPEIAPETTPAQHAKAA
ncbi:MAG: DUF4230 domain-containing protein [Clostridia bacterium]